MNPALDSGSLRHRVTVQSQTAGTPDGKGNLRQTWQSLYADVPASVEPSYKPETYASEQVQSQGSHTVSIRYLPSITATNRLLFGSRVFQVNGVENVQERNITLKLYCDEVFN
jgi:SPP1 family predicted phage head-tail adaptor